METEGCSSQRELTACAKIQARELATLFWFQIME